MKINQVSYMRFISWSLDEMYFSFLYSVDICVYDLSGECINGVIGMKRNVFSYNVHRNVFNY